MRPGRYCGPDPTRSTAVGVLGGWYPERRVRVVVVIPLVLVACGRLGFEEPAPSSDGAVGDGAASDGPAGDGPIGGIDAAIDAPVAGPGTTTFGETPTANVTSVTTDAYMSDEGGSTTSNYGGSTSLGCEGSEKRALLRFDLSSLAPGTPVTSVVLRLSFTGGAAGTVMFRPVLEAWTEGTQSGAAGVVNHLQRTAGTSWTTVGAGSPGSSGASFMSFTASSGANTVALPAATVQSWVDTPSTNFGILIACSGDSNISSRENATTTSRPQLDVTHQ